ncbi:MAG: hypothetical protein ACE37H_15775 [Phycisphaeraceae bacterium]
MRKMYNTKRLLGAATCAVALFAAAPAFTQAGELEIELEAPADEANADQKVDVSETGAIDLHVKELEITKVLQLLSIQSKRNIIASRGVENAKVSADLYGVSFDQALKSILEPNGFGYVEEGNFIYVLTKDELAERDLDKRKVTTKIYRMDYLRADEAATFVTPLLSEKGAITASGNVEDGFDPSIDNAGADNYAGPPTLVIRDFEDNVSEITAILDELDMEPKQVIIEATVLRTTLTENNQFGVDFSLFTDLTGASPLDIIDGAISGGAPDNQRFAALESVVGDVASQSGGVKLGFVAGDAGVFISALDSVTDSTIVASPKAMVVDRTPAKILVGEKVAYLSTTVTETSETQTVEFLEVGTQLNVRPFVSSDGRVRLELRPSVSDATIRNIGSTSAPDESTVEMVTNVIVDSGQTIVLGGLITEDTSITRSQVPGLGSIPLLGKAFQGQDDTVTKSEVIFLVKATVVDNQQLIDMGKTAQAKIDVARVAEREALLPWSRTKVTAGHMGNARELYDEALTLEGEARKAKMAEALYCVDMALHLNPSMVDALVLKEKITGSASYTKYDESLVRDVYETLLDDELKALGIEALPAKQGAAPQAPAEGLNLIEPEPLTQVEPEAEPFAQATDDTEFETETEPQPFDAQAQAEADEAWLAQVEAELLSEENAKPQQADAVEPESTDLADALEGTSVPTPAEPSEGFIIEVIEDEPADEVAQPEPGVFTDAATDDTEPQSNGVFGFSWRSLTTAQLLQLAAEASATAEAEATADANYDADAEPENTTADVPTQTD